MQVARQRKRVQTTSNNTTVVKVLPDPKVEVEAEVEDQVIDLNSDNEDLVEVPIGEVLQKETNKVAQGDTYYYDSPCINRAERFKQHLSDFGQFFVQLWHSIISGLKNVRDSIRARFFPNSFNFNEI